MNSREPEIKDLNREELIHWGSHLESRFGSMLEFNPPECHDILKQPRDEVREIVRLMTEQNRDSAFLKIRADELADEYKQWNGEPTSQVHDLCSRASRWCDTQGSGQHIAEP